MLLHTFLDHLAENKAVREAAKFLREGNDGASRAEFMGHFLDSVFQPIYQIDRENLIPIGFEAFLRPLVDNSSIAPAKYFEELAKDDKSFADLLCRELHTANFLKQANDGKFLSLNVEPVSLADHMERLDELRAQLQTFARQGLTASRIMLEVDMSPGLDAGVVYTYADNLKELGIGITLEDFDADCASFSRIIHNRPQVVKFNRSWLDGNCLDPGYLKMVCKVVDAIQAFGAASHLERVETKRELLFAVACGFDRVQGFFLNHPSSKLNHQELKIPY